MKLIGRNKERCVCCLQADHLKMSSWILCECVLPFSIRINPKIVKKRGKINTNGENVHCKSGCCVQTWEVKGNAGGKLGGKIPRQSPSSAENKPDEFFQRVARSGFMMGSDLTCKMNNNKFLAPDKVQRC